MQQIISAWNNDRQIIEGQFGFASQHIINNYTETVYEIIIENGGEPIISEDIESYIIPISTVADLKEQGWLYTFYDHKTYNETQAKRRVEKYYCK